MYMYVRRYTKKKISCVCIMMCIGVRIYTCIIRTCICLLDLGFFSLFSQLPVLSVEQLRAAIDSLGHIVEALSVQVYIAYNMYKTHV